MKRTIYRVSRLILIFLITLLYTVIFFGYNDVFGLSLDEKGNLAIGIDLSDEKTVIVYDSEFNIVNNIKLSVMGKYKFGIENDNIIIYSKRSKNIFTYDFEGNVISENDMSKDEYNAIPNNPISVKSSNGDEYMIKNFCGFTEVICIRDGRENVLYSSDVNDVVFRLVFIIACYVITVVLCIYLFWMFKGKYDEFDR